MQDTIIYMSWRKFIVLQFDLAINFSLYLHHPHVALRSKNLRITDVIGDYIGNRRIKIHEANGMK